MPMHYQSFLVRLWNLGEQNERIEVEHIQSGSKRVLHTRSEAVEWMRAIDQPFDETRRKEDARNRDSRGTVHDQAGSPR